MKNKIMKFHGIIGGIYYDIIHSYYTPDGLLCAIAMKYYGSLPPLIRSAILCEENKLEEIR